MSDMRIQNLLQSMAQGRGAHKGDYTLSDVRFDLSGDALSSSLKNLLGSITGKMNAIAQSAALEMRVVEKDENGKITLAYKNEIYEVTIPKDQREQAKDFKAGDKLVLLSGGQDDAANDLYFFVKLDAGKLNPATVNIAAHTMPAAAVDGVSAAIPVTPEQKFAERIATLQDLEAKIDALRAIIPTGAVPQNSVLRRFTVDLDHPSTQLIVPKVALETKLSVDVVRDAALHLYLALSENKSAGAGGAIDKGQVSSLVQTPIIKAANVAQIEYVPVEQTDAPMKSAALLLNGAAQSESIKSAAMDYQGTADVAQYRGSAEHIIQSRLPVGESLSHIAPPSVGWTLSKHAVLSDGALNEAIPVTPKNSQSSPEIIVVEKPQLQQSRAFHAENLFMSSLRVVDEALVDEGRLTNNAAHNLSVKVIGETPRGEKVVQPEWPHWPARSAMVLGLKNNEDVRAFQGMQYGDVLSVRLPVGSEAGSVDVPAAALMGAERAERPVKENQAQVTQTLNGAENIAQSKHLSPFLVNSAFYSDVAKLFDGLAAQSLILPMQMGAAQTGVMLPNLTRPEAMPAALLFLVAAMRSGDVGAMLSDKASDKLSELGKAAALSKFLKSAASKGAEVFSSRPEQGSSAEWKSVMLPMQAEGQISAVALHWRDYPSGQNGESGGEEEQIARFVLDFTLSAMGDVQLDGFFKRETLNVALRLSALPSDEMQSRIISFYHDALDQVGLGGELRFQLVSDKAMRFVITQG